MKPAFLVYGSIAVALVMVAVAVGFLMTGSRQSPVIAYNLDGPRIRILQAFVDGNLKEARKLVEEELQSKPGDREMQILKLRILVESGRLAEAKKLAEGIEPKDAGTFVILARIYERMGYPDMAVTFLVKAAEERKEDSYIWKKLALVQYRNERYAEALSSVQMSLRLDPDQEDLKKLSSKIAMDMADANKAGVPESGTGRTGPRRGPGVPEIPDPRKLIPRPEDYLPKPNRGPR